MSHTWISDEITSQKEISRVENLQREQSRGAHLMSIFRHLFYSETHLFSAAFTSSALLSPQVPFTPPLSCGLVRRQDKIVGGQEVDFGEKWVQGAATNVAIIFSGKYSSLSRDLFFLQFPRFSAFSPIFLLLPVFSKCVKNANTPQNKFRRRYDVTFFRGCYDTWHPITLQHGCCVFLRRVTATEKISMIGKFRR